MAILEFQFPQRLLFEDKTNQGKLLNAVALRRGATCWIGGRGNPELKQVTGSTLFYEGNYRHTHRTVHQGGGGAEGRQGAVDCAAAGMPPQQRLSHLLPPMD